MEYKIGDIVKVRDDLQVGEVYGECEVTRGMLKYRGTINFIDNIYSDEDYILKSMNDLDDTNHFLWNKDMLALIITKDGLERFTHVDKIKGGNGMEYKIGDVVEIRDDLKKGEKYGDCDVNERMLKFKGTTDTIESIDEDGDFYLAGKDNPFAWHKDMLEPVIMEDDLKEEMKGENNMKYEIGDVVRIKNNLQEGEKYGELNVMDYMLPFRGTIDIIENIDPDGDYHLANNNNPYVWSKEMLEPVELKEEITLSSDLKSTTPNISRLTIYQYLLNHLEETYEAKNNDYGNSVADTYDKFGCVSFLVRITDKYNRLMTLCDPNAPEQKVKDEKIDDTILDLANYCLLWLVEREYKNQ